MNTSFLRQAIVLTCVLSLSGCFDIPEDGLLNSSWQSESANEVGTAPNYFSQNNANNCPDFFDNQMQPTVSLPDEFSVASWNIYKQQNDGWKNELAHFMNEYDLVMLQEAKLGFLLQQTLANSKVSWTQVGAFNVYKQPVGVLTASRVAPISACKSTLSEPWIRFPKSSLITYYPWQDGQQTLLQANLHAINFTLGADEFNEQLSEIIDVIRAHKGPVILAGDFNTWTNKRLNSLLESTKSVDLFEVTYNADERVTTFGLPLDSIFYRGLRLISATSIVTEASDHNPLIATFAPEE